MSKKENFMTVNSGRVKQDEKGILSFGTVFVSVFVLSVMLFAACDSSLSNIINGGTETLPKITRTGDLATITDMTPTGTTVGTYTSTVTINTWALEGTHKDSFEISVDGTVTIKNELTLGTYEYMVTATDADGKKGVLTETLTVTDGQVMEITLDESKVSVGDDEAVLTWTPPITGFKDLQGTKATIQKHIVYYGKQTEYTSKEAFKKAYNLAESLELSMEKGSSHLLTIPNLDKETYYIVIKAADEEGQSALSNIIEVTPIDGATPNAAPGLVQSITTSPGPGQVTLNWTEPSELGSIHGDGTKGIITRYTVYYSKSEIDNLFSPEVQSETFGTALTGTVEGLDNFTPYYFAVTASNEFAEGRGLKEDGSSQQVTATPVPADTGPDAPETVTAEAGNNSVQISWRAPANTGVSRGAIGNITEYKIYYSDDPTALSNLSSLTPVVVSAGEVRKVINNLNNDTAYHFVVVAVNGFADGTASAVVTATPSGTAAYGSVPDAPTIGTITAGKGKATVSWTAPVDTGSTAGGSPTTITGYTVYYSTSAEFTPSGAMGKKEVTGDTSLEVDVTDLQSEETYYFVVSASNEIGESKPSTVSPGTIILITDADEVKKRADLVKKFLYLFMKTPMAFDGRTIGLNNDVPVTWNSDNTAIAIDEVDKVITITQPAAEAEDVEVILTATITKGAAEQTVTQTITIPKSNNQGLNDLTEAEFNLIITPSTPLEFKSGILTTDVATLSTEGSLDLVPGVYNNNDGSYFPYAADYYWVIYSSDGNTVETDKFTIDTEFKISINDTITSTDTAFNLRAVSTGTKYAKGTYKEIALGLIPIDGTPPTITPPDSLSAITDASISGTEVGKYTADETISLWALTGADATSFTITPSGVLETAKQLSEKTYTITVKATDEAGNIGTLDQTLDVTDGTPPTITPPDSLSAITDASISGTEVGKYTADETISLWALTGTDATSFTIAPSGVLATAKQLSEKTYTFTVKATDKAGNIGTLDQTLVVTEGTPPTITPPDSLSAITDASISGTEVGKYTADETISLWVLTGTDATSFTITPSGVLETAKQLSEKTYTFTVKATDEAGNIGTLDQTLDVTDGTPPTITPPDSLSAITIASISGTEVGRYTADETISLWALTGDVSGSFTISKDGVVTTTKVIPVGKYTFTVNATDEADNVGILDQILFVPASLSWMVYVEGGTFTMGSPSDEPGRDSDEVQHDVTVNSFYMSKYEVTQARYEAVMGENPSNFSGDNKPVEQVSWYDAVNFCNELSEDEGLEKVYTINGLDVTADWLKKGYRLPTEAEWEYAARGGKKTKGYVYSGSNTLGDIAWYKDNSGATTLEVGTKDANELGLYDMNGNVWEWCWDRYGSYGSDTQTNPVGPSSGTPRILRGGSWDYDAKYVRVAYRFTGDPEYDLSNYGFRLVLPTL